MASLREIGTQGVAGLRPTAMSQVIICNYLAQDELLNILRFVPIGMGNTLGNFIASFITSNGDVEATFRELGVDYEANNQEFNIETVQLKMLGGALTSDRAVQRAFGTNSGGNDMYTENQIIQKIDAIKKAFAKWFIKGNSGTDAKQFDGIESKIPSSQIVNTPIDFSNFTAGKAETAERDINKALGLMKYIPTFWLTNRTGKANLVTLNSYRYKGVDVKNINGLDYNMSMGIPVIAVSDDCFVEDDLVDKNPVYGIYTNESQGVRVAIPNDGKLIDVLYPVFNNGKVIEKGTCEMIAAPIFADKMSMVKFYISETVA